MKVMKRDQMTEEIINLGANLALAVDSLTYSETRDGVQFTRFSELNDIMGRVKKNYSNSNFWPNFCRKFKFLTKISIFDENNFDF